MTPVGPVSETVTICNRRGLHARAAARFVRMVENRFPARVTVAKDGATVGGASIMGLLMLSASRGTQVTITVEGEGAGDILRELVLLVEQKFDEED